MAQLYKVFTGFVIGGTLIAVGVYFWDRIRETISTWLRENGYQMSDLMDAWIQIDNFVTTIRYQLFVRIKQQTTEIQISERILPIDEIDDPQILAMLEKQKQILIMIDIN